MSKVTPLSIVPAPVVEAKDAGKTTRSNHRGQVAPASGLPVGPAPFNPLSLQPFDPDRSPSMTAEKAGQAIAQLTELARPFGLPVDTPENRVRTARKLKSDIDNAFIVVAGRLYYSGAPTSTDIQAMLRSRLFAYLADIPTERRAKNFYLDSVAKSILQKDAPERLEERQSIFYPKTDHERTFYAQTIQPIYDRYVPSVVTRASTVTLGGPTARFTKKHFPSGTGSQIYLLHKAVAEAVAQSPNPIAERIANELGEHLAGVFSAVSDVSELARLNQTISQVVDAISQIERHAFSMVGSMVKTGSFSVVSDDTDCMSAVSNSGSALHRLMFLTRSGVIQSKYNGDSWPQMGYRVDGAYRAMGFQSPDGDIHGLAIGNGDDALLRIAFHAIQRQVNRVNSDECTPFEYGAMTRLCQMINDGVSRIAPDYLISHHASVSILAFWPGARDQSFQGRENSKFRMQNPNYESFWMTTFEPSNSFVFFESSADVNGEDIVLDAKKIPLDQRVEYQEGKQINTDSYYVLPPWLPSTGGQAGPIADGTLIGKKTEKVYTFQAEGGKSRWNFWMSANVSKALNDLGMAKSNVAAFADQHWYYPVDHIADALFKRSAQTEGFVTVTRMTGMGKNTPIFPESLFVKRVMAAQCIGVPEATTYLGEVVPRVGAVQRQKEPEVRAPGVYDYVFTDPSKRAKPFTVRVQSPVLPDRDKRLFREMVSTNIKGFDPFGVLPDLTQSKMDATYQFFSQGNVFCDAQPTVRRLGAVLPDHYAMISIKGQSDIAAKAWLQSARYIATLDWGLSAFDRAASSFAFNKMYSRQYQHHTNTQFDGLSLRGHTKSLMRLGPQDGAFVIGDYTLFKVDDGTVLLGPRQTRASMGLDQNGQGCLNSVSDFDWTKQSSFPNGLFAIVTQTVLDAANGTKRLSALITSLNRGKTLDTSQNIAKKVLEEINLLPSVNAGVLIFERK